MDWQIHPKKDGISSQVANTLRDAIACGQLKPNDRIPSSRQLAKELGLARGTVVSALETLAAEGLLDVRVGAGCWVSKDATFAGSAQKEQQQLIPVSEFPEPDMDEAAPPKVIDLRPCRPSLDGFPKTQWRRCLADSAGALSADYEEARGDVHLRRAVLDYLRRARGLVAEDEEIIITNGSLHAMSLLGDVMLDAKKQVFFEDPGYPMARQVFAQRGVDMHYCDIDSAGLIVDQLPAKSPRALVYVTPSHQFPMGSRLSLARRKALLEWAQRNQALIVEDDYDGEYRYDVAPLPPLAALSRTHVAYCGTFSKTMFPGLRIGYAIASKSIIDAMARRRSLIDYTGSTPLQRALARFISQGDFERHIHRMRRQYRAKRQLVDDAIQESTLPLNLIGLDSGLHAVIELGHGLSAKELQMKAAERGTLLTSVDRYRVGTALDQAIVVGYAEPSAESLQRGLGHFLF